MLNAKSQNPGVVSLQKLWRRARISLRDFFNDSIFEIWSRKSNNLLSSRGAALFFCRLSGCRSCPGVSPRRIARIGTLVRLAESSRTSMRSYPIRAGYSIFKVPARLFCLSLLYSNTGGSKPNVFSNFLTGFAVALALTASLPINWELFSLNDEKNIAPLFR
jgi:hypothetical protein